MKPFFSQKEASPQGGETRPGLDRWSWPLYALLSLCTGLGLALAAELVASQSLWASFYSLAAARVWYTALLLGCFVGLAGLVGHSLFVGGLLTAVPVLLLAFVNYFKMAITATPFLLKDLLLADRAADIAKLNAASLRLSRNSVVAIGAVVLWLVALALLSRYVRHRWRWELLAALLPAALLAGVFWVGLDRLVLAPLGASMEERLTQSAVNQQCGVHLGLWRAVRIQATPTDGSWEDWNYMERLTDEVEVETADRAGGREGRPNIILILSESFFDVTTLPGVSFETDPLEGFHALRQEGVSGSFHTRTLGYGTCNIELEILTGINTYLLGNEDLYSMDPAYVSRLPAVPQLLKEEGYRTVMLHTFDDSIYHRGPLMEAIGFDETYFSHDFAQIDPEAAAAGEIYWNYMATKLSGDYYSDAYVTELFEKLLQAEGEGPLFLYGVTMENHTPHSADKYAPEERTVFPQSDLEGEAADVLTAACQGAAQASAALKELTDFLREWEEPTVVIFYGDHRPGLGLEDGIHTVYSELGMCETNRQWDWSAEEKEELYTTSYLIWSNDPDYLPAPAGTVREESSNYMGLNLLKSAGLPLPLYWRMLDQLAETQLMYTYEYSLTRDGTYSLAPKVEGEGWDQLERFRLFLGDALYGGQYVTERLWK